MLNYHPQHITGHGHLSHLEGDGAAMGDNLGTDLDPVLRYRGRGRCSTCFGETRVGYWLRLLKNS